MSDLARLAAKDIFASILANEGHPGMPKGNRSCLEAKVGEDLLWATMKSRAIMNKTRFAIRANLFSIRTHEKLYQNQTIPNQHFPITTQVDYRNVRYFKRKYYYYH